MKLVIAEKPSVGTNIASVLGATNKNKGFIEGNGYIVSWCIGHLVELAMPESYNASLSNWSIDTLPIIPQMWKFAVSKKTAEQYKLLKTLLNRSDVDEVICATDAGREGECIFRYVYKLSKCSKPVKRLWISSVEENEIRNGFANLTPDSNYDRLYNAGYARSKADWLVGMNATRLFSCAYKSKLTIGRVQTPTLNLIVKREYDISNFTPEKYYTVVIDCNKFKAESEKINNIEDAMKLSENANNSYAFIKSINTEKKTVNPPKLLNLADLQKTANRTLGLTAQQTLDIAQELYEKKLITYPRTDSNYVNASMTDKLYQLCNVSVDFMKTATYSPTVNAVINDKKVTDHHALLPTLSISDNKNLELLTVTQKKILQLICTQLICATGIPHHLEQTVITLKCADADFTAKGNKIIENGWKTAYKICYEQIMEKNISSKEVIFPSDIAEGVVIDNVKSEIANHQTTPPKHFTDASLIAAMEKAGNDDYDDENAEKKGIGTQATQAGIIQKIIRTGYVQRSGKNLIPTDKGINLINILPEYIKSPKLTAEWECKLQAIEKGQYQADTFMKEIEEFTTELVRTYANINNINNKVSFKNKFFCKCPLCGKDVLETSKAYSCCGGKNGCGLVVWKTIAGKVITESVAKNLILNGTTSMLKGFISKSGKNFSARLYIDADKSVKFLFE
ncbi:MAG: DNA topoisomerase 3 [Oscillospiraceae bacterium]|nr:DNA topoisomerase 3 [Oscillospiraceae bacterium]